MGKNIFEIWKENNEELPFRVRRDNWTMPNVFILVEKIEINKWPYGTAYGKCMKLDQEEKEVISDWQYHCEYGVVKCAGCYQWYIFSP